MATALVRAQGRQVGCIVVTGPLISGLAIAVAGWLMTTVWPTVRVMILVNWLSQIFLICVGVCVAVAVTGDSLIELHESTETSFRTVQAIRASLPTIVSLVGAIIMFIPLHMLHIWPHDEGWLCVGSPIGAVMIISSVAFITSAYSKTTTVTTIAVIAAWMFLSMLWDPYVLPLPAQRGIPLAFIMTILPFAWQRLGNTELNIRKVATI
ncbi:hypothetical protein [Actinomyces ruminis]|uniref:hypothetical protein n=1 Tax=Actinomyces ruminis TaxID=1937003 RepID=UPI000B6B0AE4|nr:hypothetical protein [Actinomyces ruminis]